MGYDQDREASWERPGRKEDRRTIGDVQDGKRTGGLLADQER